MKKDTIKKIAQAVLLERLNSNTYAKLVRNIKHKVDIPKWEQQDILMNFGLPMTTTRTAEKQYKNIVKIVKERIALDKEINKINRAMPQDYCPYQYADDEEEYEDDDYDEEDDY